ncbi:nucleic acid/nucleotide deaminase domain-containing protein [Streptomyces sp. HNM0574]|uniref:nucleic acid/nucleotide deaminase domain-containing protein n=1 Tax=Streptomyces sp. HNM0574 TaxID=2714954 RepID=UPI00146B638F|nr:nucleic acid/nucleotide deaminase domain-containing protein [Streptomyces sp. HNM0574]NLU70856.1 hypothetical protein [Streptomyces sp. HNM0574]
MDEILEFIGINFPNVDEDDYREMADALREFADGFEGKGGDAHVAVNRILSGSEGWAKDSLEGHWQKVKSGHLDKIPEVSRTFATALDGTAEIIFAMKTKAEIELGVMAASVGIAIGAAWVTGGLSALIGAAEIQAMRQLMKRLIDEAVDRIVDEVVSQLTEPVVGKFNELVEDALLDLADDALSLPPGTYAPGGGGGNSGGNHGGGPTGTQLNSADGPGAMQLNSAGGGGDGGGKMKIDPDEHDQGATKLAGFGTDMQNDGLKSLKRARTAHGRAKGKGEVLTQAVDEVAEGALGAAEKVVARAGKHIGDTVPKNLKGAAKKHRDNDQAIADDLKGIGNKSVYHVGDRGAVTRLSSTGHQPLTDDDRRRLAPLGLQGDNVGKRSRKDYPLPAQGDRTRKSSEQVELGESDLAKATRAARNVNEDYGTEHKDGRFTSRNYAAVRHGESGSEDEFILVGRSKFPGAHSEDQVGIPFLNSGSEGGLTELYTEREPCTSGKGAMDCSAWMGEHLPEDMKVSHSVEYGNTEESKQKGNQEMRDYLTGLRSGGK